MISDENSITIQKECDFNHYSFGSVDHNVSSNCYNLMSEAKLSVGDYTDNYDVIVDVCYPSIVEQQLRLRKMVISLIIPLPN